MAGAAPSLALRVPQARALPRAHLRTRTLWHKRDLQRTQGDTHPDVTRNTSVHVRHFNQEHAHSHATKCTYNARQPCPAHGDVHGGCESRPIPVPRDCRATQRASAAPSAALAMARLPWSATGSARTTCREMATLKGRRASEQALSPGLLHYHRAEWNQWMHHWPLFLPSDARASMRAGWGTGVANGTGRPAPGTPESPVLGAA